MTPRSPTTYPGPRSAGDGPQALRTLGKCSTAQPRPSPDTRKYERAFPPLPVKVLLNTSASPRPVAPQSNNAKPSADWRVRGGPRDASVPLHILPKPLLGFVSVPHCLFTPSLRPILESWSPAGSLLAHPESQKPHFIKALALSLSKSSAAAALKTNVSGHSVPGKLDFKLPSTSTAPNAG